MQRIDPLRQSWPLFGTEATRVVERDAASTLPEHTLMQRAGIAVARLALALAPHASRVWIAAGPGNNGGDGLEAALHLLRAGKSVHVTLLGDAARLPSDAARSLASAQAAGVSISPDAGPSLEPQDLAIDALLGIGSNRAASGALAQCIDRLNALPCAVLAVDVPSGLNADTGQPLGDAVVRARHTLSLLALKIGLVTGRGRDCAGTLWLDTLGIELPDEGQARLTGGSTVQGPWLTRRHAQHKGDFGDVHVVGGARGMRGAALLAARAAHAAGAGRVHVALLDETAAEIDPMRPELMFRPSWWLQSAPQIAASTIVCGCGGGTQIAAALPPLLSHASRLVLDADALNAIAADSALQTLLRARAKRGRATILTPHPLEAARLLNSTSPQVQADRLAAALQLANDYTCVVVLKGSGTVIAGPGALPQINATGNAALASAGTGDVLAGWIGGWWAQADSLELANTLHVAAASVFRHGLAADEAHINPLRAADLIDAMMR